MLEIEEEYHGSYLLLQVDVLNLLLACAAAVPCPIPGPIDARPIANPAAITDAPDTIGFIISGFVF
jgi:hypothetical protein